MRKIISFIVVFVLMFSTSNIYSQGKERRLDIASPSRKDPFLAGILSWYTPGLGQIYTENYWKGVIIWGIEQSLFFTGLLMIADINFGVNETVGFQLNIKPKETISDEKKVICVSLFLTLGIFHIYNVVDAVRSAKDFNKKLYALHSKVDYEFILVNNTIYSGIKFNF